MASIDIRRVWPNEAQDFTPWLAKNLERLSDLIGIPLELEDTEVRLGRLSSDIIARDSLDGSRVLIENQLEKSDHTHLGQILTYLAGHEAKTAIWVATDFQKAHRSAIRWLNENTSAPYSFFAIKVETSKSGDSRFQVREPLSERERQIQASQERQRNQQIRVASQKKRGSLSERGQFLSEFWRCYAEYYPDDGVRKDLAGYNAYHSIEDSELHVSQYVAPKSNVVGVFIGKQRNADSQESVFEIANPYGSTLMNALGFDPDQPLTTFTADCGRYYAQVSSLEEYDFNDRANWTEAGRLVARISTTLLGHTHRNARPSILKIQISRKS